MDCFLLQKNILLMRLILLGYYAAFFPVKFPRITSSKHCTTPRRHTSAGCTIMGHHGAVPALFLPMRTSAHPASPSSKCCSKGIAQILALNVQNRTLLQKAQFFTVKNRGVVASQTRSPPICSVM